MKRTQRLSIEFQHREVVIAVRTSGVDSQQATHQQVHPEVVSTAVICEVCGSPWIPVDVHEGEEASPNALSIHRALEQAGMHLHVSPTGQLNICRKSLEDLKEKR